MIDVSIIKPKCKLLKPKVLFFNEVTSTNEVAWKHLSAENAQNNVVVIADVQSKGKGRFSRTWYSPSGENLYLSILLNISIPLDRIHLITAIGALAALDTVAENTASGKACIVFPNDVHINGKKISGVLAECKLISGNPDAFVLGIGVNVNTIKFPSEIVSLATSLKLLENKPFELERIATTLLERIDHYYSCISDNIFEIYEKWRSNNYAIGKHVELKLLQKSVISGMLVDTDPVDGVLIKSTNGTLIRYRFENIQHIQITKSPD